MFGKKPKPVCPPAPTSPIDFQALAESDQREPKPVQLPEPTAPIDLAQKPWCPHVGQRVYYCCWYSVDWWEEGFARVVKYDYDKHGLRLFKLRSLHASKFVFAYRAELELPATEQLLLKFGLS
jgi:hypothetical protein